MTTTCDNDGTSHLVDYSYLGRNTFVELDLPEPDLKCTLIGTAGGNDPDTGDIYRGLDRFTRIKDQQWYDYGASADADRVKHGYNRAGNRLYREQTTDTNHFFDELYHYLLPSLRFPEVLGFQKEAVQNTFVVPPSSNSQFTKESWPRRDLE